MTSQSRWATLGTLVGVALALAACTAPIRVNGYAERGSDLSRYATYDFAPVEAVPTGDPRLDSNPFFTERVRTATERELRSRGYERAVGQAPEFLVHFHASVNQAINVDELDRTSGYCAEGDCRPFVYDAGTLLMDLVDAKTKKMLWRGWAETNIDGIIDNQKWMNETIDTSVAKIAAKMPRHS